MIQKINIKDLVGEQKKSTPNGSSKKSDGKDSGGILGGLVGTAVAALPLVPKKYIAIAGFGIFLMLYGGVSLIWDIVHLFY